MFAEQETRLFTKIYLLVASAFKNKSLADLVLDEKYVGVCSFM